MKYTYPKTYKNKPLNEQWKILQKLFPELKKQKQPTTNYAAAEGLFIIPHYKLFGTYNEAVLKCIEIIKTTHDCYDWRNGNWSADYLKQLPIKEHFWDTQDNVIALGVQFGQKHAGESVETVRAGLETNELPLGMYEVLIMLLTHPERLQSYDDLWIDCPGDEYSYNAAGVFSGSPVFRFDALLRFGADDLSYARGGYGSASGFVPQKLEYRTLDASRSLEPLDDITAINYLKGRGFKISREETITKEY